MIALAYDGSDDAKEAIKHLAEIAPGADVAVVTVWERFLDAMARTGSMSMALASSAAEAQGVDKINEDGARELAEEGAALARETGLSAAAQVAVRHQGIGATLLRAAHELGANLIVTGTRGRSPLKTFVLGSVAQDLLQHSDLPVLVVPSPTIADRRRARNH